MRPHVRARTHTRAHARTRRCAQSVVHSSDAKEASISSVVSPRSNIVEVGIKTNIQRSQHSENTHTQWLCDRQTDMAAHADARKTKHA
mmetsp:Transcript_74091/g.130782  ORF Transcript_74091/g.130782 Transcript_74091/m.130782 type:complete len:88 (-) Transcript_74091:162-425(-)